MAASGSNSTTVYKPNSSYGATLSVSFTENSTSTTNNTSNITCTAKMTYTNTKWSVTNSGLLRVYWHDNKDNVDVLVAELYFDELGYNTTERTASGTINVTHKDDGKLSGYAYAAWTCLRQYNNYVPNSGGVDTGWKDLTTIARKSVPTATITTMSLPATSGSFTVNTNRASTSFTHTIRLKCGSTTISTKTSVGASTSFNLADIDDAILATIPSDTSTTLTVECETFNGSTSIGTNSINISVSVNDNAKPTFTNFGYSDTNSAITAITDNNQVLVSGKSTLTATISTSQKATGKYSATMQSYTMTINGVSQSQAYSTSAITKNLGTVTLSTQETTNTVKSLVITAIDSRSKSTSVTKDITVIPYRAPIVNASATRENGFENNTTIKISGTFSPILVNNTAKNNVSTSSGVEYRYKRASETTWTHDWQSLTATVNRTNGTVSVADFVIVLDNQEAWNFEIKITDLLETTIASMTVSVGQPAFFIGEDGRVGVGGMPNKSKLTGEQGLVQVFGRLFADNIYPVGSIYMSATLDTVAKVQDALGGTWVKWGAGRVPVGVDTTQTEFNTVGKTGGEKTHTLTVNEMPSHTHNKLAINALTSDASLVDRIASASTSRTDAKTMNLSNTGGGAAHNNLQPYITCYMYKRTA